MKQIFTLFLFITLSNATNAQLFTREKVRNNSTAGKDNIDNKILSYGYYLGFNSLDFKFQYKNNNNQDIDVTTSTGFNVGLIGNLKLSNYVDLRFEPGLSFTTRTLNYPESYTTPELDFSETSNSERIVKSTYVYFPFLLKLSTKRINNIKPFLLAGASAAINLSSNENSLDDNSAGKFRMKSNPKFLELGFGIDFYLYNFKFTPSIRGVFAQGNELVNDKDTNSPWTGNITKMQTRGVFINFTVQ